MELVLLTFLIIICIPLVNLSIADSSNGKINQKLMIVGFSGFKERIKDELYKE